MAEEEEEEEASKEVAASKEGGGEEGESLGWGEFAIEAVNSEGERC